MKKLVLEILCAGGHHHALAGHQCRNKIRVGLARACSGFDRKQAVVLESIGNRLRHLLLCSAWNESWDCVGQWTVSAEESCGFTFNGHFNIPTCVGSLIH